MVVLGEELTSMAGLNVNVEHCSPDLASGASKLRRNAPGFGGGYD